MATAGADGRSQPGPELGQRPAGLSHRLLLVAAASLFAAAVAIFLLSLASARQGLVFGPDDATRLLAFEFIAVALLLALASSGDRIRLTLQMMLVYMAIYLILPGYHHSSGNEYPFFNMQYEHRIRFSAAVIVSIFLVSLIVGYLLAEQTGRAGRKSRTLGQQIVFPNQVLLVFLTGLSIVLSIGYLATVGPATAFGTRGDFTFAGQNEMTIGLLIYFPRTLCFVSFAYAYVLLLRARKSGIGQFYALVNFVPFFITNYPLVLPRFVSFGIILFFLVQTIDFRSAKSRAMLAAVFVFGALVAMPVVDSVTRHEGAETSTTLAGAFDTYSNSGDFDGLQSIQNAVIYTEQQGYRGGIQLLSVALFFVPRALWADKGEATGVLTSRAAGYTFENISQPLPSEFYVDFGLTGMAIVTFLLGMSVARLDGWIDRNWENGPRARLVAGIVVAYTIIVMRGSLLGIVAPVVVFAAGVFAIIWFGLVRPRSITVRRRPRIPAEVAPSPRVARHARAVARSRGS